MEKLGVYNWYRAEVESNVDGKNISFTVVHNMSSDTFNAALDCWLARTYDYTDVSFALYVNTKQCGDIVLTEEEFQILNN